MTYDKPLPRYYSEGSREFYAACRQHELRIQRCAQCQQFRFPAQRMCPECRSVESEWAPVSGRGVITAFTVVPGYEPRSVPMFSWPAGGYPIVVIIVELAGAPGVRIVSNLLQCELDEIAVGLDVTVVFDDVTDEVTLPKFRPARATAVSNV